MKIVFIIGAERSGTTLLSEILDQHSELATWIEPFFIWEKYTYTNKNEYLDESHVNEFNQKYIKKEFSIFLKKKKKTILVEKSPENCFRINFLKRLFPSAKYIYITRDGRDVVYSTIQKIRERRNMLLIGNITKKYKILKEIFSEQPFYRNKIQEVLFEMKGHLKKKSFKFFQKSKWLGYNLWGCKFPNWENYKNLDDYEFAAHQWNTAVNYSEEAKKNLNLKNVLNISYEDLLLYRENVISSIFKFLEIRNEPMKLEKLKKYNSKNWKNLKQSEIKKIEEIQAINLKRYGY